MIRKTILGVITAELTSKPESQKSYFTVVANISKNKSIFTRCFVSNSLLAQMNIQRLSRGVKISVYGIPSEKVYLPKDGMPCIDYSLNVLDFEIISFSSLPTSNQ